MLGSRGAGLGWLLAVASAHFYLGIAPVPLRVICVAFVELRVQWWSWLFPGSFSVQGPCGESETVRGPGMLERALVNIFRPSSSSSDGWRIWGPRGKETHPFLTASYRNLFWVTGGLMAPSLWAFQVSGSHWPLFLEHLSWARHHVPQLISFTPNLKNVYIFSGMGDIMNDNKEWDRYSPHPHRTSSLVGRNRVRQSQMRPQLGECECRWVQRPKWAMMENDAKGHYLLGFQERLEMIWCCDLFLFISSLFCLHYNIISLGKWGLDGLINLPRMIHLVSGGARIWILLCQTPESKFFPPSVLVSRN